MKLLAAILFLLIGIQTTYSQQLTGKEVPGIYHISAMYIDGKPVYSRADSTITATHFFDNLKANNPNYTPEDSTRAINKGLKKSKRQGEYYLHLLDNGTVETPEKNEDGNYTGWKFDEVKQEVVLTDMHGKTEVYKLGLINSKFSLICKKDGDFLNMVIELVKD